MKDGFLPHIDSYWGKYRIPTNRYQKWNYASDGLYFITICTANRIDWFGEIHDAKMQLSEIGTIAEKYLKEIPEHFPNAYIDTFVIMPDHIHVIINIIPYEYMTQSVETRDSRVSTEMRKTKPTLRPLSISSMINQFKSVCTKHIRNSGHDDFAWQPRFHDRLIRKKEEYKKIRQYIEENPSQWGEKSKKESAYGFLFS